MFVKEVKCLLISFWNCLDSTLKIVDRNVGRLADYSYDLLLALLRRTVHGDCVQKYKSVTHE